MRERAGAPGSRGRVLQVPGATSVSNTYQGDSKMTPPLLMPASARRATYRYVRRGVNMLQ